MVSRTQILSSSHVTRAQLCNVTCPLRHALARSRRRPTIQISDCHANPVGRLNSGDGGDDIEIENEMNENENENIVEPIVYCEGNFSTRSRRVVYLLLMYTLLA